jgi:TPR repeat protein
MAVKKATTVGDTRGESREAGREAGLRLKNGKSQPKKRTKVDNRAARPAHRNKNGISGKELFERAEHLARQADKNGGPLPLALLQEAAATGYPPALYALGNWYLHGKGFRKDRKQAVRFLKQAAANKYPYAEYDLAVCYELGQGGLPKDPKAAFLWYRRAAEDGDVDAMTEVGRCYYHGLGTKKDFAKSFAWYGRAADLGASDAQYALGVAYEYGEGVEKNARTAREWYKRAAKQGDIEAAKALAELKEGANTSKA